MLQSDVTLDNIFIASMVGDIIRVSGYVKSIITAHSQHICYVTFQGITHLHESLIVSHGNLKSSNCLVDSRWIVKIADFGLHELKANSDCEDKTITNGYDCADLLYRAPELLRNANMPHCGTQKGDVYSVSLTLLKHKINK